MKTIYTTLPIYKALRDQCYERGKANGSVLFAPIYCPKHRLPSFQWLDDGDGATTIDLIEMIDAEGISKDITSYFDPPLTSYPLGAGVYFMYNGETLTESLPEGAYYLRIKVDAGHIYYSDWFLVQCVYCNFADTFTGDDFSVFDMEITAFAGAVDAYSTPVQSVYMGQSISVIFNLLTIGGATTVSFSVWDNLLSEDISNVAEVSTVGLKELTLTTISPSDNCCIRILITGANGFTTSEILIYTQYACGYVTLSFSNCCTLGDIQYETDFYQTLWIKSDNIEQQFPYVEKGQENGNGKFIPTFRRQEKTYLIRTGLIPQFLVDVLHRIKMHDAITYIDQVGDEFVVQSIDIEHEWQFGDKYYAMASITISLGEDIVAGGCCEIIT